jgi:hypothetical protein
MNGDEADGMEMGEDGMKLAGGKLSGLLNGLGGWEARWEGDQLVLS